MADFKSHTSRESYGIDQLALTLKGMLTDGFLQVLQTFLFPSKSGEKRGSSFLHWLDIPATPLCMQTAWGEMHLALNSNGDEAPLLSGVPHHTLPALFISHACYGQEPGRRAANEMDGTAQIRGEKCHRIIKIMRIPHRNCVWNAKWRLTSKLWHHTAKRIS